MVRFWFEEYFGPSKFRKAIHILSFEVKRGRAGIPMTGLTRHISVHVPNQDLDFKLHMSLTVVFNVQWADEMRGDCLFYWYWWKCWLSLLKLSFYIGKMGYWSVIYIYIELFLARQQRKYFFKRHNPPHLPQIRKRLISDMNILARELERQFLSYS